MGASASASHPSLAKDAAELHAPTIAADTDSAVPMPTLSTTSAKLPPQHSEQTFPIIPRPTGLLRGAFTGHGSNISNAIATLVTKVTIARSASALKVTTLRLTVRRTVAVTTRNSLAVMKVPPRQLSFNSVSQTNLAANTILVPSRSIQPICWQTRMQTR